MTLPRRLREESQRLDLEELQGWVKRDQEEVPEGTGQSGWVSLGNGADYTSLSTSLTSRGRTVADGAGGGEWRCGGVC